MSHHFWPYAIDADEAPPLDADRYLGWLARHQWRTIVGGVLFGVPWMLSIALVPAAIGKAIDGLVAHDEKALLVWSAAIMGLGLLSAITTDGRHWFAVRNWLIASFRTAVVTERAVPASRAGPHPADAGRRGRHQLRERLLADRQRLRRHRPDGRGRRQLPRGVGHPAARLGACSA